MRPLKAVMMARGSALRLFQPLILFGKDICPYLREALTGRNETQSRRRSAWEPTSHRPYAT